MTCMRICSAAFLNFPLPQWSVRIRGTHPRVLLHFQLPGPSHARHALSVWFWSNKHGPLTSPAQLRVAGPDSRGETIPSPSAQAVPAAPVPRPRRQWRRSGRPSQLLQRRALLENRCVSASRAPEACGRSSLATVIEAPAAPIGCLIQRRLGRLPSLH